MVVQEILAIRFEQMPQIQTKIDKISKNFSFLKFSCDFCLIFDKSGGLEC